MFHSTLTRTASRALAAATLASLLSLTGCGNDNAANPQAQGPAERTGQDTGRAVDNAANKTADAVQGAANRTNDAVNNATNNANATNQTGNSPNGTATTNSSLPSLPSVTGTNVNNLSTADAAAQRLLDSLQQEVAKPNNQSKIKALVDELQGMKNSLSADFQAKVDAAVKTAAAGNSATPPTDANNR